MQGHLQFVYEVPNHTAPNRTMACITKSCGMATVLRYYAALSGNSLLTFWDNLLVPSSGSRNPKEKSTTEVNWHILVFWGDFATCLIFSKSVTFQKLALFPFTSQEAPNLVDALDWVILSHWASQKQQLKICTWENI